MADRNIITVSLSKDDLEKLAALKSYYDKTYVPLEVTRSDVIRNAIRTMYSNLCK